MSIATDIIRIMGKNRAAARRCISTAANDRATIDVMLGGIERYTFVDGSWVDILMDKLEILSHS